MSDTTDEPWLPSSPAAHRNGMTFERYMSMISALRLTRHGWSPDDSSRSGSCGDVRRPGKKACSSGDVYRRTRACSRSVSRSMKSSSEAPSPAIAEYGLSDTSDTP